MRRTRLIRGSALLAAAVFSALTLCSCTGPGKPAATTSSSQANVDAAMFAKLKQDLSSSTTDQSLHFIHDLKVVGNGKYALPPLSAGRTKYTLVWRCQAEGDVSAESWSFDYFSNGIAQDAGIASTGCMDGLQSVSARAGLPGDLELRVETSSANITYYIAIYES